MIRFKQSYLIVGVILLAVTCNCSARTWHEFFTLPFKQIKSWYTGDTIEKKLSLVRLRLALNERLITLAIHSDYNAGVCDAFAAEVANGKFDAIINDNVVSVTPNLFTSIVSFLLSEYENMKRLSDLNSVLALGNLIATIKKRGGKALSNYPPIDDADAFNRLSSVYRVLGIMIEGSEVLLKKDKRISKEYEALVQIAAQCKELARLFYSGDPALFEYALTQQPPEIAAFASRVVS